MIFIDNLLVVFQQNLVFSNLEFYNGKKSTRQSTMEGLWGRSRQSNLAN